MSELLLDRAGRRRSPATLPRPRPGRRRRSPRPVVAIDAPAAGLDGTRLALRTPLIPDVEELQIGSGVEAFKAGVLDRQLATREHPDHVVLAVPSASRLGTQRTTSAQSASKGISGSVLARRGYLSSPTLQVSPRATRSAGPASSWGMTRVHGPKSTVVTPRSLIIPDASSHRVRTPTGTASRLTTTGSHLRKSPQ
jgi:hypothetical protein